MHPIPRLIALSIGKPRTVTHNGRTHTTAINRSPVDHPVTLTAESLHNDSVGNRSVHGGAEQALCLYPHEHYPAIAQFLGLESLPIPSFGENLTTTGLTEEAATIGDTFQLGSAILQISKPRQPCATLARKHGNPALIKFILETGYCGFYFRVLQTGTVPPHAPIQPLDRPTTQLTVRQALIAMTDPTAPDDLLQTAANCETLSPDWREALRHKLDKKRSTQRSP